MLGAARGRLGDATQFEGLAHVDIKGDLELLPALRYAVKSENA